MRLGGVAAHKVPFDVALPDRPDLSLAAGAEIVPYDALLAVVEQHARASLRLLPSIQAAVTVPVVLVQPPPPVADQERIMRSARSYASALAETGLAPAHLRLKMWLLQAEVLRRVCRESGIALIETPEDALDSEGFLAPHYFGDFVHANAGYGHRLLHEMECHGGMRKAYVRPAGPEWSEVPVFAARVR